MAMHLAIVRLRRSWIGGSRDHIGMVLREEADEKVQCFYDLLKEEHILCS